MNQIHRTTGRDRLGSVAVVLMMAGALTLASCGGSSGTTSTSASTGSTSTKQLVIGASFYNNVIPLYTLMQRGMETEAKAKNVTLKFSYANNDAATQVQQIESFISQKVSAILVTPIEASALTGVYKEARDANIPIISFGNKIADKDEDAFVGRDWSEIGERMMQSTSDAIGGKGDIIVIAASPDIEYVQSLQKGFDKVVAANPGLKIVGLSNVVDQTKTAAVSAATNLLTAHKNVRAVVGVTDDFALAALQAISELGLDKSKILVTGLNALPEAVQSIKDPGGMDYTISLKPFSWGALALDTAIDYANGKKPAAHMVLSPVQEVTRKNVNSLTQADLR